MGEESSGERRLRSTVERRIFFRLLQVLTVSVIVLLGLWATHAVSRVQTMKCRFYRWDAEDRYSSAAAAAVRNQLDSLAAVAKNACLLYAASDEVAAEEWATFLHINAVAQQPGLRSIEYTPWDRVPSEIKRADREQGHDGRPSIALCDPDDAAGGAGNATRLWMWMPVYTKAQLKAISQPKAELTVISPACDQAPRAPEGTSSFLPSDEDAEPGNAAEACTGRRPAGFVIMEVDVGKLLERARSSSVGGGALALYWGCPDDRASRCIAHSGGASFLFGRSRASTSEAGAAQRSAGAIGPPIDGFGTAILRKPVQWGLSPLWLAVVLPPGLEDGWDGVDPSMVWAIGGLGTLAAVAVTLAGTQFGSAVKRAQRVLAEMLAETRQQYQVLFESALEGLMALDEDLRIHQINTAGARLLGADAKRIAGRRLDELVTLEGDALLRQIERVIHWRLPECGQWRWTRGNTSYEIDGALAAVQIRGKWRCLAAFHNVTQQNAARRELEANAQSLREANARLRAYSEAVERASRDRIAFVASLWHEIRSPLALIVSYAELLSERSAKSSPDRQLRDQPHCDCGCGEAESSGLASRCEAVEAILHNSRHLLQLVNDILDFSKLEAGQVRLDIRPVSPRDVIAQVVSMFRIRARDKGICLESRAAPNVPECILTDPLRLRQIIANLTDNAIKFTQQGSVRIEADFADDPGEPKLRLCIRDTGIGMSEEQLGRLFQPFSQAEPDTARKYGGTGLGLVICRRLARLLGGDVWAESTPGQGTVFHVQVSAKIAAAESLAAETLTDGNWNPAEQAADAVEDGDAHDACDLAAEPVRVLFAEDCLENQRLIQRLLERGGASVTTVENGRRAVNAILPGGGRDVDGEPPFDIVLMDVEMPDMDGPTAVRTLRQSGCALPIIALTAHSDPDLLRGFMEAGYSGYLVKPITSAELWREIRRRLPRRVAGLAKA
ncbi:MAG: ATP-binding protein [Thermogutta sp.]